MKTISIILSFIFIMPSSFAEQQRSTDEMNELVTRQRLLELQMKADQERSARQAKAAKDRQNGVQQLQNLAQQTGKSGDQQKDKGNMLQGIGSMLQASAMTALAVASMLKSKGDVAGGEKMDLAGMMLLTSALGSFTQALGAFGNSQGAKDSSKGANQAANDRMNDGGGGSADGPTGLLSNGGNPFDLDSDGTVTPEEVEIGLGPDAQRTLASLDSMSPQGQSLKELVLNSMSKGQSPQDAVQGAFKIPIPASEEEVASTLGNLKGSEQLIADSFHQAGAPYHDLLAAINDPENISLKSGSGEGNSSETSRSLRDKAKDAKAALDEKITSFNASTAESAGNGGPSLPELTSLSQLQTGLFNLDKFYSKETDLDKKGFGNGQPSFLTTPGISHDPVKNLFEVMSQRYAVILMAEVHQNPVAYNGELLAFRKRLQDTAVKSTMTNLENGRAGPLHDKRKRIPTSLP